MSFSVRDRIEIQDLMSRFNLAADGHDVEAFANTFTRDGVLSTPSAVHTGHAAIVAHAERRRREREQQAHVSIQHVTSNLLTVGNATRARAFTYVQRFGVRRIDSAPVVLAVGWYEDEFHKVDGQWRIAHRSLITSLPDPLVIRDMWPPAPSESAIAIARRRNQAGGRSKAAGSSEHGG